MKHLLLLVLVCLLCIPAVAQDATAEPTNQVVEVISGEGETTVEDGGVNIVIESPVDETPSETPVTVESELSWFAKLGAVATAVLLGLRMVLKALVEAADRLSKNVALVSGAEWAASKAPAMVREQFADVGNDVERLGKIIKSSIQEAFDNQAYAAKQVMGERANPSTTSTSGPYTTTQTPPMP